MTERRIHISADERDGTFSVHIRPSPNWAPFDAEGLQSYRAAKRKAECIRIVHGWKVNDQVPAALRELTI